MKAIWVQDNEECISNYMNYYAYILLKASNIWNLMITRYIQICEHVNNRAYMYKALKISVGDVDALFYIYSRLCMYLTFYMYSNHKINLQ